MKYGVIGAQGFIGSRVVEALHLGDAASVVAISPHLSDHTLAARFYVDLRSAAPGSAAALSKALERCSIAIDAGSRAPQHLKKLVTTLVRAASAAGTRRVIYVSTSEFVSGAGRAADESPTSGRGTEQDLDARQIAAERQFLSECGRAGIMGFALRAGTVYGPRSPLIADVIAELRDNNAWLLQGGSGIFNGIYVDNLIAGIRQCLRAKQAPRSALYVADAETVTWRDFYHAVAQELELSASHIRYVDSIEALASDRTWRNRPPRPSDSLRMRLQLSPAKLGFSEASRLLGYTPTTAFHDGVRRSCAWWRFAQGIWSAAASETHG